MTSYADNPVRITEEDPRQIIEVTPDTVIRLQNELVAAQSAARQWQSDFETLAAALAYEAIQRDWCSDYSDFVDKVSNDLYLGKLSKPETHTVECRFTVQITLKATQDVVALSEAEAKAAVSRDYGYDSLVTAEMWKDAYNNCDYELVDEDYDIA